ncbi:T7SS effector LXG polymorphic toxin [Psychrobacillus psychrodurans]|uniref:LXG domain-containing protein n=1 Tax=Psychrobacillus psychrodurans TaxID=126157 RepID=A0A9X3L8T1_9BACI|nr:T7SS effector LXG polymorphic toxin [Psychrobacillus psychrodurans]MCZ8533344.1 LXG domain-containing protein [Psychrobacillus psychrodurans]
MGPIHHAVNGLVQMEDQLKGAGGNAIRSFYQECHLPFLHYFQLFSEQFKQVLQQMEAALHSLEPDSSGYILETFLDGELEQGLTLIGELTASLKVKRRETLIRVRVKAL